MGLDDVRRDLLPSIAFFFSQSFRRLAELPFSAEGRPEADGKATWEKTTTNHCYVTSTPFYGDGAEGTQAEFPPPLRNNFCERNTTACVRTSQAGVRRWGGGDWSPAKMQQVRGDERHEKKKLSGLEIFWKAGKKFSWSGKRSVKKALSVFQKREGFKLRGKKRSLLMKCADFVRLARKWLSVRWSMRFDWLTDCLYLSVDRWSIDDFTCSNVFPFRNYDFSFVLQKDTKSRTKLYEYY